MVARLGAANSHETGGDIPFDGLAVDVRRHCVNGSGNRLPPPLVAPESWTRYHSTDWEPDPGEAPALLGLYPLDTEDLGMLLRAHLITRIA